MVSGCSIDSLVNFVKELENSHDLQLLDKFHVKFIKNEEIKTLHLNDFKILCKKLKSDEKLVVYNNLISGCSIDSLVNFVKELENTHDLQLLDKFHVKFIKNGEIQTLHLNDFKMLCKKLKSDEKLVVYNNLINNINELENNWKVDIRNSWHNRFLI